MSATPTTAQAFNPQEMYDLLMERIEPELMTEHLPLLDEIYRDEQTEERKARREWYGIAFGIFERQYATFVNGWKQYYTELRTKAQELGRAAQGEEDAANVDVISESLEHS